MCAVNMTDDADMVVGKEIFDELFDRKKILSIQVMARNNKGLKSTHFPLQPPLDGADWSQLKLIRRDDGWRMEALSLDSLSLALSRMLILAILTSYCSSIIHLSFDYIVRYRRDKRASPTDLKTEKLQWSSAKYHYVPCWHFRPSRLLMHSHHYLAPEAMDHSIRWTVDLWDVPWHLSRILSPEKLRIILGGMFQCF